CWRGCPGRPAWRDRTDGARGGSPRVQEGNRVDGKSGKRIGRKQFLAGMATAAAAMLTGGLVKGDWFKEEVASASKPPASKTTATEALPAPAANLKDFGADPTGRKDSSDAFIRAIQWAENAAAANPAAADAD